VPACQRNAQEVDQLTYQGPDKCPKEQIDCPNKQIVIPFIHGVLNLAAIVAAVSDIASPSGRAHFHPRYIRFGSSDSSRRVAINGGGYLVPVGGSANVRFSNRPVQTIYDSGDRGRGLLLLDGIGT
jgi:hypothetical protein